MLHAVASMFCRFVLRALLVGPLVGQRWAEIRPHAWRCSNSTAPRLLLPDEAVPAANQIRNVYCLLGGIYPTEQKLDKSNS